MNMPCNVGFLVFPGASQLDLAGASHVLAMLPEVNLNYVAVTGEPVAIDCGPEIEPTSTIDTCPKLDILIVVGGEGAVNAMRDERIKDWLRDAGAACEFLASTGAGALVLGSAGLLQGYRASMGGPCEHMLTLFSGVACSAPITVDRNRISASGFAAGWEVGLALIGVLRGTAFSNLARVRLGAPTSSGDGRRLAHAVAHIEPKHAPESAA